MSTLSLTPTTFLHLASIVIGAVVLGLATVNFGVLSIWINSTAASFALVYHITILVLSWRRNRVISISPKGTVPSMHPPKYSTFVPDAKLPTYPLPAYSPPPYDAEKLSPNRLPSVHLVVPKQTNDQGRPVPSGPFYTLSSFFSIAVSTIITIVGFGMTVEVSIHGAKSLLPAERAKGMTFPWNMKIQKAQCTFLGVQMLLSLIVLALCAKGRMEISRFEEEKREEIEYGFASPDVSVS